MFVEGEVALTDQGVDEQIKEAIFGEFGTLQSKKAGKFTLRSPAQSPPWSDVAKLTV